MADGNSGVGGGNVLNNINPGSRVRNLVGGDGPDMMQGASMNMPSDPGPSVAGRTPMLGTLRRERGIPVVRDQLPDLMG